MAARYIRNLFACTAARAMGEDMESGDENSDDNEEQQAQGHAGSLGVVTRIFKNIAMQDTNEGETGTGKHCATIQLGRAQWETTPLTVEQEKHVEEVPGRS